MQLRSVRDELLQLPALPWSIWMGGSLLVLLATLGQMIRFRRLVSTSTPADRATEALVARSASDLGLGTVPMTFMVDRAISPMISGGRTVRLLLPQQLWDELDDMGRRAVLAHELAHIRRRDHWVCWIDMVAGVVYWWHPVVWWIRRRVREEADLSCDAWVTSLLPAARRAYACALLRTRCSTTSVERGAPGLALAASSIRAKRFARRITMVMSHSITPTRTFGGIALAATIITGGWLVTPTLACPPDQKEERAAQREKEREAKATERTRVRASSTTAPSRLRVPKAPTPPTPPTPPTAPEAGNTFEQFMRDRDVEGMSLEERIELLEKQFDSLMKNSQRRSSMSFAPQATLTSGYAVLTTADGCVSSLAVAGAPECDATSAFVLAAAPDAGCCESAKVTSFAAAPSDCCEGSEATSFAAAPSDCCEGSTVATFAAPPSACCDSASATPYAAIPANLYSGTPAPAVFASMPPMAPMPAYTALFPGDDEELIRNYPISKGKREALWDLMADADVPTLVSQSDDGIQVHGNAHDQLIFEAFVTMIDGEEGETEVKVSGERLELLTELMVREDVPIFVRPGDGQITVMGTDLERKVFEAFARMIDPKGGGKVRQTVASGGGKAAAYEARAREAAAKRASLDQMHAALQAIEQQMAQFEDQADALEDMIDQIEDQIDDEDDRDEDDRSSR